MEELETTNIHIEWLKNIHQQLMEIQNLERLAIEGCSNLGEYMQIPFELKEVIIPDIQYKNMRFMALEISILLDNLAPIIPDKLDSYIKKLKPILDNIENKELFLEQKIINDKLLKVEVLPFMIRTIKYLLEIKLDIIKDIGSILYLPESTNNNKKW